MERASYQVRKHFEAAVDRGDSDLARILDGASGLLDWSDIAAYKQVDPGNAKLRGLISDVLDRGSWRLAWLPPALPYYEPADQYADPELLKFTKRLIFSAWTVVPKAIAVMMSYEAERRTIEHAGLEGRTYDEQRATAPPLQYRPSGTTLALLYPSPALAKAGDPLTVAREGHHALPVPRNAMIDMVRARVEALVARLGVKAELGGAPDSRWYLAAPVLLDRLDCGADNGAFVGLIREAQKASTEEGTNLGDHLALIESLEHLPADGNGADVDLGAMPSDLVPVLTDIALAGPGVTGLRALSRVCGGTESLIDPVVRSEAFRVAQGLRSLFNKPEIITVLRASDGEAYWREVLHHSIDGCLQAVLDEYVHGLLESEGLQDAGPHARAEAIAAEMAEALSIRTASNTVEDVRVEDGRVRTDPQRAGSHFAARYGRAQSNDNAVMRESTVRSAYNSPFRPFVLASTSVGQEGLDFHTYSHAIVQWNLPGNPVDLEQREGRVHRYKGHAVRKNVAAVHGGAALDAAFDDPWAAVFDAAVAARGEADSDVVPFWVSTFEGGATIERYVPALPLSRELQHYKRLLRTVVTYRLLLGQPRQDDLIATVGADAEWLRIDLAPPGK
jgi:hypothetical protein